jgi:hypothetical protein
MEEGSGNRLQHTREDIYYYPQLASAQECSDPSQARQEDRTTQARQISTDLQHLYTLVMRHSHFRRKRIIAVTPSESSTARGESRSGRVLARTNNSAQGCERGTSPRRNDCRRLSIKEWGLRYWTRMLAIMRWEHRGISRRCEEKAGNSIRRVRDKEESG